MLDNEEREYGRRGDDLEVKAPFGWSLKAGGRQVSIIVIVFLIGALLGYQQFVSDARSENNFQDLAKRQRENVKTITDSQQKLTDSIDIQTWLSTKTDSEKQALRMDMPDALCRKIDCNRSIVRAR